MKNRVLIFLLLMLMTFSAIYASEDTNEQEEYFRKKQELDLLSERFKAETGFEGSFTYRFTDTKFSQLTGKFSDIKVVAYSDTTYMKQVFEAILRKIMPYLSANESQLSKTSIESGPYQIHLSYIQFVNGYSVSGGGRLGISYHPDLDQFTITNSTVDISETPIPLNVSSENAIRLLTNEYEKSEYYDEDVARHKQGPSIRYESMIVDGQAQPFRLYWSMYFLDHQYSIDVETGKIHYQRIKTFHDVYTYTVKGETYEPTNTGFPPTNPPEMPMNGIKVSNGSEFGTTSESGIITFSTTPSSLYTVDFQNTRSRIESWNVGGVVLSVNNWAPSGLLNFETIISDLIPTGNVNSEYAANIYYHLMKQDSFFNSVKPNFQYETYPIIYNDCAYLLQMGWVGGFTPSVPPSIAYVNGLNPYHIRHELSHFFTYNYLGSNTFYNGLDMSYDAMDEAFAEYWLTQGIGSTLRNWDGNSYDIYLYSVYNVLTSNMFNPQHLPLNEHFYSWYHNRMPIASAWENIRIRLVNQNFNQILCDALNNVDVINPDRHKPRYFFNRLMENANTPTKEIIAQAYAENDLFLYPKVESISSANTARNIFGLNEPVHVKISDCPQNTRVNIYVIKHGDYTYTDGALVTGLSSFYANGFSPITNVTTDPSGEWSGYIWTTPSSAADAVGDYDIIVNIGSPNTPDDYIHFAFSGANVMDGFDGTAISKPKAFTLSPFDNRFTTFLLSASNTLY